MKILNNQILYSILSIILLVSNVQAQSNNTPSKDTKTAQPTIMAIPFAREGQSLRAVYENDEIT